MASIRTSCSRFCVPRILATVIGTATFITLATSTVFTVLNAIAWAHSPPKFRTAATAASVFEVLAILSLFLAFVSGTCSWDVKRLPNNLSWRLVPAWCISIALVAIGLTVWTSTLKHRHEAFLATRSPSVWTAPPSAEYAVWASATVFQLAFYSIILLGRVRTCSSRTHSIPSSPRSQRSNRDPKSISATTGDTETTLPLSLGTIQTRTGRSSFGRTPPLSPSYPCRSSSSPIQSWRDSLQQAVRPMTSKTKLIRPNGSYAASDARSFESTSPRHSDAFDAWDTSDVDPGFKEAVIHGGSAVTRSHTTPRGTAPQPRGATPLPTIPGSRPVSQADLLESPLRAETAEKSGSAGSTEAVNRTSQDGPKSTQTPSPKQPQFASVPYPLNTTDLPPPLPIRTSSRSASPALFSSPLDPPSDPYDFSDLPMPDESFIHPLFRSESPTPPPRAHPGTSITGSPFSGAIIPAPARAPSRMRSSSPSPSLLRDIPGAFPAHAASTTSLPHSRLAPSQSTDSLLTLRQVASFDRGANGPLPEATEARQGRSRSASRASNFSVTTHESVPWTGSRAGTAGPRAIVGVGLSNAPSLGKKMSSETFRSVPPTTAAGAKAAASSSSTPPLPMPASSKAAREGRGRSMSPRPRKGSKGEEPKAESRGTGSGGVSRPGSVRTQRSVREGDELAPIPSFVLAAREEKMG